MRRYQFLPLLIISLIFLSNVPASAQTVVLKGLVTLEFSLKEGKIKVRLPEDILPGETVSGTVISEPAGNTEKETSRNMESLQKYSLNLLDGVNGKLSLTNHFLVSIQSASPSVELASGNKVISTLAIPVKNNPATASSVSVPTHALTEGPLRITGPFDGDAANTKCSIDGSPMEILAESPKQCIVQMPQISSGPHTITIADNGHTTEKKVSAVNMDVSAGKLNLQKGEKTYVEVAITGLQDLPADATLTVVNNTTGIVTMAGGESQAITIPPAGISGAGTFNKRFDLQSTRTGSFAVTINLDLPENNDALSTTGRWKACPLIITSCILPSTTCEQLQKGMQEKLNAQPLLAATEPADEPLYSTSLQTTVTNDMVLPALSGTGTMLTDQVIFSYEKIMDDYKTRKEKNETHQYVLDRDSVVIDGFGTKIPVAQFSPGLYSFHATSYYGSNQEYTHTNYVVVPGRRNPPTISNDEIERLRREEQRLRDSINAINRRIENSTNRMNENYKRRRYLDSLRWIQSALYNQLHTIDALIEQIPGLYGDKLKALLDSLEKFKQKAGTLDQAALQAAVDKMKQEVDDLEAALKACQDHLAALQKEQQDLKDEKEKIQKDQQQAFRDIMNELGDQGYQYAGYTSRDPGGGMKFDFGLVLRGANGEPELVRGIPAQSLKKISALQKQIKDGNNRINEINARQAELPGEIAKAKAECDDIAARLAKAKAALAKGVNNVTEYNYNMADLDELCSEIKKLLEPLSNWCQQHPGECGSFQGALSQLMNDCPQNLAALPNLMNALNGIITQKKQVEDGHKKKADDLGKQIGDKDKENEGLGNGIGHDQDKAEGYGGDLGKNLSDQDKAIADALAKKQADEAAKAAARKKTCVEFLKEQLQGDEAKAGLLALMESIKEQVQSMGGTIGQGLGAASELTKGKTKEKIEKVNEALEKILGPLEKYDEFKEQLDELKDIKEKLETILSGDDSPEAMAQKFGASLGLIKKVLDKIADKVPLLQFFTAYFGYLVDGYNAAVEGTYKIFRSRFKEICEAALAKTDCQTLMNEYMKRNSLEDVYAKAYQLCQGDIYGDSHTSEWRRLFQEAVNQAALKKLIDCCLKWSSD